MVVRRGCLNVANGAPLSESIASRANAGLVISIDASIQIAYLYDTNGCVFHHFAARFGCRSMLWP